MAVVQLCVQVKKESGAIQHITDVLKREGVIILAISVSSHKEEGLVSMVVDDPEMAGNIFESKGFSFTKNEVIVVALPDHPGGLHAILEPLKAAQINVLQLYSFFPQPSSLGLFVIVVDQGKEAVTVFERNWIQVLGEEVYGN